MPHCVPKSSCVMIEPQPTTAGEVDCNGWTSIDTGNLIEDTES